MNKAWLSAVLLLSGCSTVIATDPPADMTGFAEVDVASADKPDLTLYRIRSLDMHAVGDYFQEESKPRRLYLKTGRYQAVLNCDKDYTAPDGKVLHSVLTDISPRFEFEVQAGNKYLLGCKPDHMTDGFYLQKQ